MSNVITVIDNSCDMRRWSRDQRRLGKRIAFVPTMGYLHEGHLNLIDIAKQHADVVVASIYVNPTQFSKNEDFDVYPRQVQEDRSKLESRGCHAVFEPASLYAKVEGAEENSNVVGNEAVHPDAHETFVQVERLKIPL